MIVSFSKATTKNRVAVCSVITEQDRLISVICIKNNSIYIESLPQASSRAMGLICRINKK